MVIIAKHENKTILIYKQTNSIFSLPSAPPLEKFWFSGLCCLFFPSYGGSLLVILSPSQHFLGYQKQNKTEFG